MTRLMKESGIDWIGEIPKNWCLSRTKHYYTNHKYIVGEKNTEYERLALTLNGVIKRNKEDNTGLQPEDFSSYQILSNDELVFKLIDLQNISTSRVGLSPYTGIVSPAYIILHKKDSVNPKYGEYYFLSMWQREIFNRMGDDGVRSSLNSSDLLNIPYIFPPLPEQEKIVSFLNKKCSKINIILSKTKESIDEYKRLKNAIIIQSVIKGIRPNRKMKDSGIKWLGEIPEDWKIRKGWTILSLLERPVKDDDGVITCFRDGEVTLRSNRRQEGFTFSVQEAGYQGIEPGDLVVHGMDGFAGSIGISDSRGKATPVLNVMDSSQNKKYIMYYLRSLAYQGVFISLATGIRIRTCDTNWNKLKNLPYLLPNLEEQKEIADYIDSKIDRINTLITKKEQLITELETYKKSLIYEYVTGKKEVQ